MEAEGPFTDLESWQPKCLNRGAAPPGSRGGSRSRFATGRNPPPAGGRELTLVLPFESLLELCESRQVIEAEVPLTGVLFPLAFLAAAVIVAVSAYTMQLFGGDESGRMVPILGVSLIVVVFLINLSGNRLIQGVAFFTGCGCQPWPLCSIQSRSAALSGSSCIPTPL